MSEAAAQRFGLRQQLGYAAAALGLVGVVAGLMLAFRSFAPVSTYSAASSSMEPTLHIGDVVVARGARQLCGWVKPKLGEVVVYRRDDVDFIKRAVAGPGQNVEMRHGRVIVDGVQYQTKNVGRWEAEEEFPSAVLRETQPNGSTYKVLDREPNGEFDNFGPRRLASDQWWMLGDNRDNAMDSRVTGPVGQKEICGVALRVISSTEAANVGRKP